MKYEELLGRKELVELCVTTPTNPSYRTSLHIPRLSKRSRQYRRTVPPNTLVVTIYLVLIGLSMLTLYFVT